MKSMLLVATICAVSAGEVLAGCGGGGGGGGYGGGYSGGYGGGLGGVYGGGQCNSGDYYGTPYGSQRYSGQAYEPYHNSYFVQPGDTFHEVSLKEYGTSAVARHIARFNRLSENAALVPGQRLMLPSVSASGKLKASRSPAPQVASTQRASGSSTTFASTTTPAPTSEPLPKVTPGSTLKLDEQQFGNEAGVVRLRIGGLALPVEVLEWTASSAKIRLPKLDLSSATPADIEIHRADGSLAAKSSVELTPEAASLAATN